MAKEGEHLEEVIKSAQNANTWAHFGFSELGEICVNLTKICCVFDVRHRKLKNLRNTGNLRRHIRRCHLEKLMPVTVKETADPAQSRIDAMLSPRLPNSEKKKKYVQCVAAFLAKDLRPYSVMENSWFVPPAEDT